jgi:hypothetical protein
MHRVPKPGPDKESRWVLLYVHEFDGVWAAMLVADDVTPPESGKITTIYARMAREDEAWQAKALMKAFRNSQTSVPVYRYLQVPRVGNSQQFRASGVRWPRRRPGSPGVPPGSVASP